MMKSRTPSSDSFAQALASLNVKTDLSRTAIANNTVSITPTEPRSRKASTKSQLCPVVEGCVVKFFSNLNMNSNEEYKFK